MPTTSNDYQRMTPLPEDLERALLDAPCTAMLHRLRKEKAHRSLTGVSEKYTAVQFMARSLSEADVRKFLAADHAGETDDLTIADKPAPLLQRRSVVPVHSGADAYNGVETATGAPLGSGASHSKPAITSGGLPGSAVRVRPVAGADVSGLDETRKTIMVIIQKAAGECISVGDIRKAYGKPAAASVAKLLDAGIVELCE